jgi:ABC-type oligopeptide transport system substrate-binding subunit/class 3 adenylate cyclase
VPAEFGFCPKCGSAVAASAVAAERDTQALLSHAIQRLIPKEYAERLLATRGQPHDERRTVTILFCDVKGSTPMAEKLDPEDVKEIMHGVFEFLIAPIYHYEGTLAQLMGDAILAFFGAPITHEDDPERACRAALDIITEAQKYAEKVKVERGIEAFGVRVGINTGLVVMGEVGSDLRVEYTAVGDAINLAARMETAAEPGTVLITEATHKLIAPLFETQALGPIQVKGKGVPVSVYRVLAAKAVGGKMRGVAGLESPLVGRESEFGALHEALERLRAGVGGIVTIVGEAGLGKSRLVAEVRKTADVIVEDLAGGSATARPHSAEAISRVKERDWFGEPMPRNDGRQRTPRNDQRVQWVEGRCLSYGSSIAYLLWLDVLRGLLGVTAEDSLEHVRDILQERLQALCAETADCYFAYLARMMSLPLDAGLESQLRELDGQQLKAGTFEAVEAVLTGAAGEHPLAVVLEDMHWADPTSLELLERLLALTDRTSVLFICIFRPQAEHGSWRIRETAARSYEHRHTDLRLRPLSSAESEALLSNLVGLPTLGTAFQERVLRHAEGNPFYLEEIIRALIGSRAIVRDAAGRWRLTQDVDDLPIPETLQGVLVSRIDRLREDTKRVLQMAAVIGRTFLYRLLITIAEQEKDLDQHLLALQREQMIRERARIPELEYIFKHHLTQEAAYNGLLKKERRTLHRQVAQALERLFPERLEEEVGLLAHHWEQAGDGARAVPYLLRAGDQARTAYAHAEAVDYYRRALVFQEPQADPEPAARTWLKLGLTYHTAFDYRKSQESYARGFEEWQRAAQSPGISSAVAPHALRVALKSDPPTLDPARCNDTTSSAILTQLFRPLVQFTPELDVVPDAAQSWEICDGGLRYVFHLRTDMRWSDGRPVTAGDFAYRFQRRGLVQSPTDEPTRRRFKAVDDATLLMELEEPTGYVLQLLTWAWPVPRHVVEKYGEAWTEPANIVTNGPFRLEAKEPGSRLVLERDAHYHGSFTGNIQRVEVTTLQGGAEAQLAAYERDELDIADLFFLPRLELQRVRQQYAGEYVTLTGSGLFYVEFDLTRPPFDDPRVRRAFVLAVDREALLRQLTADVIPATGGIVPPGMPGHSPGIALPYDPQAAKELLAQAGYGPEGRLPFPTVDIWYHRGKAWSETVERLMAHWRLSLGIDMRAESMDWGAYLNRLSRGTPHVWTMAWNADYPDPDNFLRVAISEYRRGGRKLPYEELLERARRITDQSERMQLYRQADRIVMGEAVVMPVAYAGRSYLLKPWVKRYPLSAISAEFWKDVVIEGH